jgi:hypothetical protein
MRYFMSVSVPSSFEIFQTHFALWVCAAMLLYLINYDIFIQPGTPSKKTSNNNENWSYFVSDIVIYFREIVENNFPSPPELGRPKASIFRSRGVPGRLDALLVKSLAPGTTLLRYIDIPITRYLIFRYNGISSWSIIVGIIGISLRLYI